MRGIIYREHILTELVFRRPVTCYERIRGGNNFAFATRGGDIRTPLVSYKDDMSRVPNVRGVKANYILGRKLNLGVPCRKYRLSITTEETIVLIKITNTIDPCMHVQTNFPVSTKFINFQNILITMAKYISTEKKNIEKFIYGI